MPQQYIDWRGWTTCFSLTLIGLNGERMGICIVLLMYFVVLSILAAGCSAVLAGVTRWYLRDQPKGRARVALYSAVLPFACVLYAGVWFIAYAVINDVVFHHDPMLGDGWYTDIGNGYAIDMIDVTDYGTVHRTQGDSRGLNSPDGVSGVRRLQIEGTQIFGSEGQNIFQNFGSGKKEENEFFVIDTRTHAKKEFASEADLAVFAQRAGVVLALRPIVDVYREHSNNGSEMSAGIVLLVVPAAGLGWLVRRVLRLKREGLMLSQTKVESGDVGK